MPALDCRGLESLESCSNAPTCANMASHQAQCERRKSAVTFLPAWHCLAREAIGKAALFATEQDYPPVTPSKPQHRDWIFAHYILGTTTPRRPWEHPSIWFLATLNFTELPGGDIETLPSSCSFHPFPILSAKKRQTLFANFPSSNFPSTSPHFSIRISVTQLYWFLGVPGTPSEAQLAALGRWKRHCRQLRQGRWGWKRGRGVRPSNFLRRTGSSVSSTVRSWNIHEYYHESSFCVICINMLVIYYYSIWL